MSISFQHLSGLLGENEDHYVSGVTILDFVCVEDFNDAVDFVVGHKG